jgi:hypothetical protein
VAGVGGEGGARRGAGARRGGRGEGAQGGGEERQPRRAWEERHGDDPGTRQVGGGGGSIEGRGRVGERLT